MPKLSAYTLVFLSSTCLMIMELIAGRLIAPYVGSSIYTWTSVIGIFLLGITLGNWLGGRLADAFPKKTFFGPIFLLAALSGLMIIFITPSWAEVPKLNLSLPAAISIFSFLTFFPVAFFLSFISPFCIKLALQRLEQTGRIVGNIYGLSAAGSIFGTFAAGFWLIPSFGTKQIVWSVFAILAAIGFYFIFISFRRKFTVMLFLLGVTYLGWSGWQRPVLCLLESQYYCIRVNELVAGEYRGLALALDQLEHSHIYPPEVDPFGDDYVRLFGLLTSYRFKPQDSFKVLAIGGGGYVLPRYLINNYPQAEVTVLEIDPQVTATNFSKTNLKPDDRLRIIHGDARINLNRLPEEKFDLIFGDAFNDFQVPFHLTTQEFVASIKNHLEPNGFYAMNLIDNPQYGQFFSSNLLTVAAIFPQTYLFPFSPQWATTSIRRNAVILGAGQTLDDKKWTATIPLNDPRWSKADRQALVNIKYYLPGDNADIKNLHQRAQGLILTDNYAPLETMLAHLYSRRY